MNLPARYPDGIRRAWRPHAWLWTAAGNHQYGQPGGFLQRTLHVQLLQAALAGGLGLLGYLGTGEPFAAVIALVVLAGTHALLHPRRARYRAGLYGERAVARELCKVSDAAILHDLALSGENADHVILTHQGAFLIETKNVAHVHANPTGLWVRRRPNHHVTAQATRVARRLSRLMRVPVQPVVVFVHPTTRLWVSEVDGVTLTRLSRLSTTLARLRRNAPDLPPRAVQAAWDALVHHTRPGGTP